MGLLGKVRFLELWWDAFGYHLLWCAPAGVRGVDECAFLFITFNNMCCARKKVLLFDQGKVPLGRHVLVMERACRRKFFKDVNFGFALKNFT